MSPVRHEDDFKRKPIKDWESYVEDAITKAQQEGEFDNLPGHGKPLKIETNPLAPELDFAFSRLKNAGYLPTWMELDQQVKAAQEQLQRFLEDSVTYLQRHAAEIRAGRAADAPKVVRRSWWQRLMHGSADLAPVTDGPATLADLRDIRARMRTQYLARSAELDTKIGEFNDSLSRDLWHLERMRLTQDRAARRFDEAMSGVELASA